jgi:hypothetical protein
MYEGESNETLESEMAELFVKENSCVTVKEVAAMLDVSRGSAHHIVQDVLHFHEVTTRWMPRQMTPELEDRRVDACQELLRLHEAEGDGFLKSIVTSTSTNLRRIGQGKNKVIPAHQIPKNF